MNKPYILSLCLFAAGCATVPQDTFVVTAQQLERRQLETRRYDGISEVDLLSASSNVLQDLGFNLDNSEVKLGVITASKDRDAFDGGELVAAVLVALLGGGSMAMSKDQKIRVSLIVRSVNDGGGVPVINSNFVRVTFQRIVQRTDGTVFSETLRDTALYQDFYERVSKSVFIEAQKI